MWEGSPGWGLRAQKGKESFHASRGILCRVLERKWDKDGFQVRVREPASAVRV